MSSQENEKDDLERERIKIEWRRLQLEEAKLKLERNKVKWTTLSVFIPLLVVALTFLGSVRTQAQQAQDTFEIKAAEIVMNTESPSATLNRARALAALFPDRLPPGFADSFEPGLYSGSPPLEPTIELFRQLVDHTDQKASIIELWEEIFYGTYYYMYP